MSIDCQTADFGDGRMVLKFDREGPFPIGADNPLAIVLREALGRDPKELAPLLIHEITVNPNAVTLKKRKRRLKA